MPQPTRHRPRPNTYRIDNVFIDDYAPRIGPIGVAVYNVLARHAERDSGLCHIGIYKIGKKLNLGRTAVKKYLHLLFAEGLIAIIPQYLEQGGQTANSYLLLDISPEGRARRQKQLNALMHASDPLPEPGGSPDDRPPAQRGHLATPGGPPGDHIQQSFFQDISPDDEKADDDEDDLPEVQRNCPHPDHLISRLSDGITTCHRCFRLLNKYRSKSSPSAPPPVAPADGTPEAQQHPDGNDVPKRPQNPDDVSEASSEDASKAT